VRAAWYERLGPAREVLCLGELDPPTPGPGEVLVRVTASGINPSDTKKRGGWGGGTLDDERIVPHSDGAGVIEGVGAGVGRARRGERVWLYNAQFGRAHGTAAELVALPAELAVPLPDAVAFTEAACLGVPACTAHSALLWAGPIEGKTVLVQGGAGAVGEYAIQMAALAGARVLATVSSPEKAAVAREAGADVILDYRAEADLSAAVREAASGGVDHIVEVDFGANAAVDASVLAPRGTIGAYSSTRAPRFELDYYGFGYKGARIAFIQVYMLEAGERERVVADLTRWMGAGQLRHRVARRFPLAEIAAAHEAVEAGHAIGNVVLDV